MTPTLAPRPAAVPAARAAATMGVLVAVLWLLEIVDALPRNPTGKVVKHELRATYKD